MGKMRKKSEKLERLERPLGNGRADSPAQARKKRLQEITAGRIEPGKTVVVEESQESLIQIPAEYQIQDQVWSTDISFNTLNVSPSYFEKFVYGDRHFLAPETQHSHHDHYDYQQQYFNDYQNHQHQNQNQTDMEIQYKRRASTGVNYYLDKDGEPRIGHFLSDPRFAENYNRLNHEGWKYSALSGCYERYNPARFLTEYMTRDDYVGRLTTRKGKIESEIEIEIESENMNFYPEEWTYYPDQKRYQRDRDDGTVEIMSELSFGEQMRNYRYKQRDNGEESAEKIARIEAEKKSLASQLQRARLSMDEFVNILAEAFYGEDHIEDEDATFAENLAYFVQQWNEKFDEPPVDSEANQEIKRLKESVKGLEFTNEQLKKALESKDKELAFLKNMKQEKDRWQQEKQLEQNDFIERFYEKNYKAPEIFFDPPETISLEGVTARDREAALKMQRHIELLMKTKRDY